MITSKQAREITRIPTSLAKIEKMIREAASKGEPGIYVSLYDCSDPVYDILNKSGYEISLHVGKCDRKQYWVWWGN